MKGTTGLVIPTKHRFKNDDEIWEAVDAAASRHRASAATDHSLL